MTESRSSSSLTSFVAGLVTMAVANKIYKSIFKEDKTNGESITLFFSNSCTVSFLPSNPLVHGYLIAGATCKGNDLSLFYGDVKELTTITESRKFLPSDIYRKLVLDCVICCVDCLIVRRTELGKKECLLVERSSEPAKGLWWLPGGRLLKGETFFAAARRKAQQETGLTDVTPIQVLGMNYYLLSRDSA